MSSADEGPATIWCAYAAAVIVDASGDPLRVSTRVHVITAYNPHDVVLSAAENAQRDRALGEHLRARGLRYSRTTSCAPDGDWVEHGYAIEGIDRAEALEIARRVEQRAVFEIDGGEVRVVDSEGRVRQVRGVAPPLLP